jgi:hypothetical protein
MLSPTSVLQAPDHAAGAPVRQPVHQDRGHGVQADLQGQRRGGSSQARRPASQASTWAGSDERGQYDNGQTSWQA